MHRALIAGFLVVSVTSTAGADPPVPSSAHPRLFMSAQEVALYATNAGTSTTAAASVVSRCQDTIDNPGDSTMRGGVDSDTWPGNAVACAFAYRVTQQSQFLTQALMYWSAALDDDQVIGDNLGCVQGVDTNWQTWAMTGNGNTPAVLQPITHDTGYPMRWYGPYLALTYDWLYDAPGVDAALLSQTRTCVTNWMDYYSQYGFQHDIAVSNYNAGHIIGETLAAIAFGGEGVDDHLWTATVDDLFGNLIVGQGLAGANDPVGAPVGAFAGGDWLEGWQYGPLSVTEYAVSAHALEMYGVPLPDMDAWANDLAVRYFHGTLPGLDGMWVGGDFESTASIYAPPNAGPLDAVLVGPSSDTAAAWAAYYKQQQGLTGGFVYNAFAEARMVSPQDYRAQSPEPAHWYLSRGTRTVYVRTGWDAAAFWGVFFSAPQIAGHEHFAAGNFVFSRGADNLVVDVSQYGVPGTYETNAPSADSPGVIGDYAGSQTPWSIADLPWARASDGDVYAARSDFAGAFGFDGAPSDIPYAHREWVQLPEGEVVTIDRVHTADTAHNMYVSFHVNTGGMLTPSGSVAAGPVGGSQVAIHAVDVSGGTPNIAPPSSLYDSSSCSGNPPYATCTAARLNVDIYSVLVPGPYARAIHVIDGLGASEAQAVVGALNQAPYDSNGQNSGVIGAAVYRSNTQSYVVATSAHDGATGSMMTYGVPGTSAARHVVFDAPEATDGSAQVTAAVQNGRCVLSITAGTGGGFTGHPLMFKTDTAANGCTVAESTNSGPAPAPTGGGEDAGVVIVHADGGVGDSGGVHGNDAATAGVDGATHGADGAADGGNGPVQGACGCSAAGATRPTLARTMLVGLLCVLVLRRGRGSRRARR